MSSAQWKMIADKICSEWEEAGNKLRTFRDNASTIVFTNGCFDLLHPGHMQYLAEARDCGDVLIIGLNSDESVQRLKGKDRPVRKLEERAVMLASLQMVDFVVPFSEDTPLELIKSLKPDVLVKGGDYEIEDIVGAQEVTSWGGEVKKLSFKEGYSSSALISKIKKL